MSKKEPSQIVAEATGGASVSDDLVADIREACVALEKVGIHSLLFVGIGNDGQAFTNATGDMELVMSLCERFINEAVEIDEAKS